MQSSSLGARGAERRLDSEIDIGSTSTGGAGITAILEVNLHHRCSCSKDSSCPEGIVSHTHVRHVLKIGRGDGVGR